MQSGEQSSDLKLLHQVAHGNGDAFTTLVKTYSGRLYQFIFTLCKQNSLAEEVVQDTFTQVWVSREALVSVNNFRAYLFSIAKHRAIFLIRQLDKEKQMLKEWNYLKGENDDSKDLKEWKHRLVEDAVRQLPPQQQKVWEMSRRQGKKYKEIAAELNISPESVKKYLQHANSTLTEYLKKRFISGLLIMVLLQ